MERRLAAILAADVVGYSRLIGVDEAGTLTALRNLLKELVEPTLKRHHGRVVKLMGDGMLAEFASVVDAVVAAVEIQKTTAERSAHLPEKQRIALRIGINIGDVVVEDGDLFGDGVNIAARLQEFSTPNGVAISDDGYRQLGGRLDLPFEDAGEKSLKNIRQPVRIWLWPSTNIRGDAPASDPSISLPDKPSIAVLPFDNMSGDPAQEYLGDGLTENIISSLSKISEMLVIARNSTFTYKGKPVKVQQVAKDMGVLYVLEGSVQKSGDKLRVTAQLIDAVKGHHLWSERYDRRIQDLFAIQDEITREIVVAMQVQLTEGEQARVRHRATNNLQAWGQVAMGYTLYQRYQKADNAAARQQFQRAVELDPNYASAWIWLGWTHFIEVRLGYTRDRAASVKQSAEAARKATALDDTLPDLHSLLGGLNWLSGKYDEALAEGRRAIDLDPNSAENHACLAVFTFTVGEWDETIALSKTAVRLHPHYLSWYLMNLGKAYTFEGQHDLAIASANEGLGRAESKNLEAGFHRDLAFAFMEAGNEEEARRHMAEGQRLVTRSIAFYRKFSPFKNPAHWKRFSDALRKAGLPE